MEKQPKISEEQSATSVEPTANALQEELNQLRRQLEIEASLEKVRSKAMSMRNSSELAGTSAILFQQLTELSINPKQASVGILDEENEAMELWLTQGAGSSELAQVLDYVNLNMHAVYAKYIPARKAGLPYVVTILEGAAVKEYYQNMSTYFHQTKQVYNEKECFYAFFFQQGAINLITTRELTDEECAIMIRLSQVFGLIFTRFKELKKAELQTREAIVNSAMERVRYNALTMKSSREMEQVMANMFDELQHLGIETLNCGFSIGGGANIVDDWSVHYCKNTSTEGAAQSIDLQSVSLRDLLQKAWEKKEEILFHYLNNEDSAKLYTNPDIHVAADTISSPEQYFHGYSFGEGVVWTFSLTPHSDEDRAMLRKFSVVFSLVYRRFLDLKRAEEQAREVAIDASLDLVREKAMSMSQTASFTECIDTLFAQIQGLGLPQLRTGIVIMMQEGTRMLIHTDISAGSHVHLIQSGPEIFQSQDILDLFRKSWQSQSNAFPVLTPAPEHTYSPHLFLPPIHGESSCFGYVLPFAEGFFFGWQDHPLTTEETLIYERFSVIAELTCRRFNELTRSEHSALESMRQSSIDRIRAEIASMRNTADLERITPLVWNELHKLGVPFIRCGVFIMDTLLQQINVYLSSPNGQGLSSFQLSFQTEGIVQDMLEHWRNNQFFTEHWESEDFTNWLDMLVTQGVMSADERYIREDHPEHLDLHYFPFNRGMIYVGNTTPLGHVGKENAKALTSAFAAAYARYEDFKELETAKEKIEHTLVELQHTQDRLIQSEKLASLGELTAGIAHEIQNPLNFVNNFSEVNADLTEELITLIDKGDFADAKSIAGDIHLNELKINEHGKRADAIVKSMLLHSRSSNGIKTITELNALCDEYLKLAYHGFRSRVKDCQIILETHFDQAIPLVSIIPQDVGRVLLNLFNNAFYAVHEKSKTGIEGFQPKVAVSLALENSESGIRNPEFQKGHPPGNAESANAPMRNAIMVTVKDNGIGISPSIREKIFQPFFTTKPTGQGTGLGLSLSYDIIKSHGGELRVESTPGEGTVFCIQLPLDKASNQP